MPNQKEDMRALGLSITDPAPTAWPDNLSRLPSLKVQAISIRAHDRLRLQPDIPF